MTQQSFSSTAAGSSPSRHGSSTASSFDSASTHEAQKLTSEAPEAPRPLPRPPPLLPPLQALLQRPLLPTPRRQASASSSASSAASSVASASVFRRLALASRLGSTEAGGQPSRRSNALCSSWEPCPRHEASCFPAEAKAAKATARSRAKPERLFKGEKEV